METSYRGSQRAPRLGLRQRWRCPRRQGLRLRRHLSMKRDQVCKPGAGCSQQIPLSTIRSSPGTGKGKHDAEEAKELMR
eukprot:6741219-Pyramimonas_sp.AAC.1